MTVDRRDRWTGRAPRMRDVGHVHVDHDPRAWHWFARGPMIAADGGRTDDDRGERPEGRNRDVENERLRDVSHEPNHGEGANRVWERGDDEDEEGE